MASFTLALAAAVVFGGGTGSDLAQSIAESTGSPVVIECGQMQRFGKFEYRTDDANEMVRTILKEANLRRAPGTDQTYHWPGLASTHFSLEAVRRIANDQMRTATSGIPYEHALKESKVSLKTKAGAVLLLSVLSQWKTLKPIQIDPFYSQVGVAVQASDIPEREFLNLLAKTVGARIRSTKDALVFEPNGVEVQRRAQITLADVQKSKRYAEVPELEKARVELAKAGISAASPAQLEQIVSGDGTPVKFPMTPALRQAAILLIKALMAPEDPPSPPDQQGLGPPNQVRPADLRISPAERFRNLDRRIIGTATMGLGFDVSLELATVDGLGRPGPPIQIR